ncbi:thiol-disulfide oxidoreductase ResA [Tenuibacillus multivorans]|uniref:thiol-disulfide oxidoreductase ResA n=1 Tax=Tenuibacillus multivorans TaxID=237069 RepID=UPI00116771AC|nr:thiol-disulfide oxidoreductase ResA [Tenuibacillus multivorans]GEL76120.1 thiol-disulfide oxidoreductase ResA [Tenuibacillus multivorans]
MLNKNKRLRLVFRTIVLSILVVTTIAVLYVNFQKDDPILEAGVEAPNFILDRMDSNEKIELDTLEGKGVMVNFWATYCEPCKKEMPFMEELYQEYQDQGIEIIAVSVDKNSMVIENFYNQFNLSFPLVHDKNGTIMEAYQVQPLPTSYFINPDGTIERVVKGPLTLERLESYFKEILPNNNQV